MRKEAKVTEVVRKGVDEYNVSCLRKRLLKIEPIRRILFRGGLGTIDPVANVNISFLVQVMFGWVGAERN